MAKQRNPSNPKAARLQKAIAISREFHGAHEPEIIEVTLPYDEIPKELIVIGRLVALEYEACLGQHAGKVFRHEIGDTGGRKVDTECYLCADVSRKGFWIIPANPGGKFPYFGERGIIG